MKTLLVLCAVIATALAGGINEWDCSEKGKSTLPKAGFFCVFWGISTCSASNAGYSEFEVVSSRFLRNPAFKKIEMVHLMCNTEENKQYCRDNDKTRFPRMSSSCNGVWTEAGRLNNATSMADFCTAQSSLCK